MSYGKFDSAEELLKGYLNLQSAFTRKCQYAALLKEIAEKAGLELPLTPKTGQIEAEVFEKTALGGGERKNEKGVQNASDNTKSAEKEHLDLKGEKKRGSERESGEMANENAVQSGAQKAAERFESGKDACAEQEEKMKNIPLSRLLQEIKEQNATPDSQNIIHVDLKESTEEKRFLKKRENTARAAYANSALIEKGQNAAERIKDEKAFFANAGKAEKANSDPKTQAFENIAQSASGNNGLLEDGKISGQISLPNASVQARFEGEEVNSQGIQTKKGGISGDAPPPCAEEPAAKYPLAKLLKIKTPQRGNSSPCVVTPFEKALLDALGDTRALYQALANDEQFIAGFLDSNRKLAEKVLTRYAAACARSTPPVIGKGNVYPSLPPQKPKTLEEAKGLIQHYIK